jgi:hypothetical protein
MCDCLTIRLIFRMTEITKNLFSFCMDIRNVGFFRFDYQDFDFLLNAYGFAQKLCQLFCQTHKTDISKSIVSEC